jgi:hypothetical protein
VADIVVAMTIAAVVGLAVGQTNPAAGATAFASVFGAIFAVLDRRRDRREKHEAAAREAGFATAAAVDEREVTRRRQSAQHKKARAPQVVIPDIDDASGAYAARTDPIVPPGTRISPYSAAPNVNRAKFFLWTIGLALAMSLGTYPMYTTPADQFAPWETLAALLWLVGGVALPILAFRLARDWTRGGFVGSVLMGTVVAGTQAVLVLIYEQLGIPADPALETSAGELAAGLVVLLVGVTSVAGWFGSRARTRAFSH